MRAIKVTDLRPGMQFDQPVYVDADNVLVPARIPLKDKDIDRLTRWDIEEVYTDGELVPTGEGANGHAAAAWLPAVEERLLKSYRSAVDKVELIFEDILEGTYLNHEPIDALVTDVIELIRQNKNEIIQLILLGERVERKLSVNAMNSMIVASVIGMSLKLASHRLVQLATGALLHDVGMLKVDKELLAKEGKLSEAEFARVRAHTLLGYQIISKEMRYTEEIAAAALQHHEHWDGRGYPRKLQGEDIHFFGRIVAVADAYEAMLSQRPHRNSMIGYTAMKNVLSDNGRRFDPQVLKAFLESMGVFPIGSLVQLNDGSIGRVAANQPEAPLRPTLELLADEHGTPRETTERVDLLTRKNLFIVKAIDPKLVGMGGDE